MSFVVTQRVLLLVALFYLMPVAAVPFLQLPFLLSFEKSKNPVLVLLKSERSAESAACLILSH